jgi:serine/threonine protein kinase
MNSGNRSSEDSAPEDGDGELLAGKYRIEGTLGEGGFGSVFLARDLLLDLPVAIKRLSGHAARDPAIQARFIQEARCVSRLVHPHIARVLSFENWKGEYHLVMEFLGGGSLADRMAETGVLPVGEALSIARDVLDALAVAHQHGVVHRDVKPENIIFDESGSTKLTDFGVALVPEGMGGSRVTMPGVQPGTVLFMSPEQVSGEEVDGRTDLYALGATLYQMLTGENYLGLQNCKSIPAAFLAIVRSDPVPLRDVAPEIPEDVAKLVERLLAKLPEERFPTAGAALEALTPHLTKSVLPPRPDRTHRAPPRPPEPPELQEKYRRVFELFLADGVIVSRERRVLDEKAREWGLSSETTRKIEMQVLTDSGIGYDQRDILEFEEMIRFFLVDGIIQDEEREILVAKAEQFGLSDAVVENIIRIASS